MFKVNNKDKIILLSAHFIHCSSVSIVDVQQVNVSWVLDVHMHQ